MQRELALMNASRRAARGWRAKACPTIALTIGFVSAAAGGLGQTGASAPEAGPDGIGVLKVQGNVYLLVGAGANIAAQVGSDGILVVDTGTEASAQKAAAALRRLSPKPVGWVVDTSGDADHTGGNAALPQALGGAGARPRVVAHENVLNRMSAAGGKVPDALWPNDEYFEPTKDFSFNGEAVVVYHVPKAHTDGDSIVHFRRSDVLATGDVFTPGKYPVIDVERGGTIQGLIDAVNLILRITVPLKYQEAGTYVIPGHGRLCDEADVAEFRDMVTIVRDRVRDLKSQGMTLEAVKAARPTRDYDTEYDAAAGDAFVEAIYKTLDGKK
ncbi:MAG TPA: MBL fold metallo-hydrolase [Bryobacteraceae bacterium]|nr:MBL fold metallo-hydrolase [Bryobacteraceae bacterium]